MFQCNNNKQTSQMQKRLTLTASSELKYSIKIDLELAISEQRLSKQGTAFMWQALSTAFDAQELNATNASNFTVEGECLTRSKFKH